MSAFKPSIAVRAAASFAVEQLEGRVLCSATTSPGPDPVITVVFGGTNLGLSQELGIGGNSGGHGVDPDVRADAALIDRMTKNWQPNASKTFVFNWGTISKNPNGQGDAAAAIIMPYLRQHANQQFVMIVLSDSQGAYPANQVVSDVVHGASNLSKTAFIELAPTGINFLGEQGLQPIVWGDRVVNYDVSDDKPIYGPLTVSNFAEPGQVIHISPTDSSGRVISDAVDAHNAIPNFVIRGGGSSLLANLVVSSLEMDSYKASTARAAANGSGYSSDVSGQNDVYLPGSGPPLVVDFLENMFSGGVKQFVDDAGYAIELAADKASDLVITALDFPGSYVTTAFNAAGSIVHRVTHAADSLLDAADDGLGDIESFLHNLNPFNW